MPSPNPSREREGNLKGAGIPANRLIFSEKFACPVSGFTIAEIEPRLFSFNAPQGACPACDGLGERLEFDPDRSEEHTSELQSLMRISYAVFCLKKKKTRQEKNTQ